MSSVGISPAPLFSFRGSRVRDQRGTLPFLLVSVLFSAAVLGFFHDRFWYPPDDGAYAYVAARILAGDVLHRDIQDIHPGYINFVNAWALRFLGGDLVSLRYPLVLLGVIQAGLLFLLMRPAGRLTALAGSAGLTALSFVQFVNPTAHWYGLFLAVAAIAVLAWVPREVGWRAVLLGLVLMSMLLFRQLTGVIAGIGVLGYLLLELPDGRGSGRLGRALLLIMAAGLGGYAVFKTNGAAGLLYAGPPVAILIWQAVSRRPGDGDVARLLLRLAVGALIGLAPLFLYHLAHGSLVPWYADTVAAAVGLTGLDFVGQTSFLSYAVAGLAGLFSPDSLAMAVNGLFWAVLPLLPVLLGIGVLARVVGGETIHPLPYVAAFYTVVSLHFQIPIYLFYTIGLTVAALLYLAAEGAPGWRPVLASAGVLLAATALFYQAGQPVTRGGTGIVAGERVRLIKADGLTRAPLWMVAREAELYGDLVALIERETAPDETILALPVNPELYFLADRRSALPFFNSAVAIRDDVALWSAIATLRADPPRLVFHRPDDKYNNFASAGLMAFVRGEYMKIGRYGDIEAYRLR